MMDETKGAQHPIKVVSRRTGLSPDVIRVWERRYNAVEPERSGGSRRLYTDEQIERLRLLRRATLAGRRISELAPLTTEALREVVADDESAAGELPPVTRASTPSAEAGNLMDSCMQAVRDLDARRLSQQLSRGTIELSPYHFVSELLLPLLKQVGDEWREGRIRVIHEHMATSIVRSFAHTMHADRDLPSSAPEIILATPAGQQHEMGALFASLAASTEGWRTTYLGTNLPAEELAAAVHQRQARVLALSIVYPVDDPQLPDELVRLRRHAGDDITILVGGRACEGYRPSFSEISAVVVDSFDAFRLELERVRLA